MIKLLQNNCFRGSIRPAFKGYTDTTTMKDGLGCNSDTMCIHQTYFFRNLETLDFVKNYISENYKKGTNIADFASSTGEEAYSLAMLLKPKNQDKKYKITGYDIVPRVIDDMNSRIYELVTGNQIEKMLNDSNQEDNGLKKMFDESFERIPRDWQEFSYTPKNTKKIIDRLVKTKDDKEKRELNYMLSFSKIPPQYVWNDYVIPKKSAFDGIVDFKVRDISELGQTFELPKNTGVVFFKNAFYHLIRKYPDGSFDLSAAENVAKEINKSLPKNGLLVTGALQRDQFYNGQAPSGKVVQNGKAIDVFLDSPFQKMLSKNGFEPVFFEQVNDMDANPLLRGVYLPSVWKKVSEV